MHTATKGSKVDISSEKKLGEFANNFSSKLKQGDIFFLYGEMGVGKTTFVKFLINNMQLRSKKELTEVLKKSEDITNMSFEEYEIYIDDYTKKSKYPDINQ